MIRFGVIGAGRIAKTFSLAVNGIHETLYAIASRDLEKANQFKEEFGYQKAYGSYEQLLDDELVDCVYIATPHALHFEQMKSCLEKGKHILCEKSFTLNHEQAKIIYDLAESKNLFVMEAMWTRFLPTIQEVQKLVKDDAIGDIFRIEASFGFETNKDLKDRLLNPVLGGGTLLDIGIYPITLANMFLGIPDSFESNAFFHPSGVDTSSKITYYYPEAEAILNMSFMDNIGNDAYIYGTKGYFHIPNFHACEVATLYNNNHKVVKMIEHPHIVNGLEYEIVETIQCIKKKAIESSIMTHEISLEILRQMDEIRKSWNFKYPQELG
jgi:predicted dehydrogenase